MEAQEYLKKNFKNKKVKELNISNKNLEGELDLSDYKHLEEIRISDNKITGLVLPEKNNTIKVLDINNTNIEFYLVNVPESLKEFYCFAGGNPAWRVYAFEHNLKLKAKEKGLPADDGEAMAKVVKLWEKEL